MLVMNWSLVIYYRQYGWGLKAMSNSNINKIFVVPSFPLKLETQESPVLGVFVVIIIVIISGENTPW